MKTKAKILTVILAICLVAAMLPMAAMAEEADPEDVAVTTTEEEATPEEEPAAEEEATEGEEEAVAPSVEVPSIWAVEIVTAAYEAGIVPDALMANYTQATTRAEFCALATALYEKVVGAEIEERSQFDDTDDVNVEKMAALGVVNGVGDGKFDPDAKLTREQAATMLARLATALEKPMPEEDATFADTDAVSDWAIDAVGSVQAAGIMNGVGDNNFAPADEYTREQSIVTMMRMFDYYNAVPEETTEDAESEEDAEPAEDAEVAGDVEDTEDVADTEDAA